MAYDSSIITFTTKTDKVDLVSASHINAVQTEIVTIETILGTGLKGTAADLSTRLNKALDGDGSILSGTSFPSPALTSQQFWRTDLNVLYIYTGTTWSPQSGLTSYAAGANMIAGPSDFVNIVGDTSYTKVVELIVPRGGTLRVKFSLHTGAGATVYGRIYRNGVAVGTEQNTTTDLYDNSEDISGWSAGDLLQLWAKGTAFSGSGEAGMVKVYELTPVSEIFTAGGTIKGSGVMIYRGSENPPAGSLGSVGDLYMYTGGGASTTLYVKTGASTWTAK